VHLRGRSHRHRREAFSARRCAVQNVEEARGKVAGGKEERDLPTPCFPASIPPGFLALLLDWAIAIPGNLSLTMNV
jgi:hypothetical protein